MYTQNDHHRSLSPNGIVVNRLKKNMKHNFGQTAKATTSYNIEKCILQNKYDHEVSIKAVNVQQNGSLIATVVAACLAPALKNPRFVKTVAMSIEYSFLWLINLFTILSGYFQF